MPAIILFHVQANLFLFNKTNLPPPVCRGVIQAFCITKRKEESVRNNLLMGKAGVKIVCACYFECVSYTHVGTYLIQEYMETRKIALKVGLFFLGLHWGERLNHRLKRHVLISKY